MIQFENITKTYENNQNVVSNLNLTIHDGEFFVLIGPSGCGKTTTLKMINRLSPSSSGVIRIHDKDITAYNLNELRWNIGYVLQQIALFPNMTVEENIKVVPEMKKWSKEEMNQRVTELLDSVGLDAERFRHKKPTELSGGEQQRVGVIRALAANPDIILMDEPFSALDPISRKKLQEDVRLLQKKVKKTIVFVTHDMQEALYLGDRIALMQKGKVVQVGTPDEIRMHPKNEFVREFLHSGNIEMPDSNTIDTLLKKSHVSPPIADWQNLFSLKSSDSIPNLVQALSKHEQVIILDDENQPLGIISPQQYLTYLGETIETGGAS